MVLRLILFFISLWHLAAAGSAENKGKVLSGVFYFNRIFGNIHPHPTPYSAALTTVACGQPLKVFIYPEKPKEAWQSVEGAGHTGHVLGEYLETQRPSCFQQKYPHFFNKLELDLTEMYFWGRLYDQYISVKTEVQ